VRYKNLGKSGIKVSELSFGSWLTFGSALDSDGAKLLMKAAFERGINFFDNAEVYANGRSETIMGEALRAFKREDLVISTKIFWGGEGPNDTGLSRKHLIEGTRNSLKRLKIDYVDLLFCHRPDHSTPIAETVLAMDYIVRSGMAFYWGTSEWSAERIQEAFEYATMHHLIPPTMEQPEYNMLVRNRVEKEYAPLYERYGLGTTIWSPLASGILTGKYNSGVPKGSRLEMQPWLRDRLTDETLDVTRELAKIAQSLNCSMAQLAIAWCLKNRNVSTVIMGATSVKQLEENLTALEARDRLGKGDMEQIEKILALLPSPSAVLNG